MIDAALKRGWEIVAHNYVQTELLADYSFDENKEREVIRETLRVNKEVCGKPAKGWLSSSLRCTLNTIDINAEEGLIFTTDLLNDDQPYLSRRVPERRSFRSPIRPRSTTSHHVHSDRPGRQRRIQRAQGAVRLALSREREIRRFMNVGLHPHVCRHPLRFAFARFTISSLTSSSSATFVRHSRGDRRVVPEESPHAYFVMSQSPRRRLQSGHAPDAGLPRRRGKNSAPARTHRAPISIAASNASKRSNQR